MGKSFPSLGDLPKRGIKPGPPALQANSADILPSEPPGKPYIDCNYLFIYIYIYIYILHDYDQSSKEENNSSDKCVISLYNRKVVEAADKMVS